MYFQDTGKNVITESQKKIVVYFVAVVIRIISLHIWYCKFNKREIIIFVGNNIKFDSLKGMVYKPTKFCI